MAATTRFATAADSLREALLAVATLLRGCAEAAGARRVALVRGSAVTRGLFFDGVLAAVFLRA